MGRRACETFYRRYWGGACQGIYYLLRESSPGIDPLGPDNVLCISAGIAGIPASGFNRYSIQAKSPLTGALIDSQAAGFFGPELRHAGWDGIVIEGRAGQPVYVYIQDGKVDIRDARSLWGLSTGDTETQIRQEVQEPKARICCIGPAGENLVRFACVVTDRHHVNGRSGAGAVFGSKNLKAIAVRGTVGLPLADQDEIRRRNKLFAERIRTNPDNSNLKAIGTGYYVNANNVRGMLPIRNFQAGWYENADRLSGETFKETIMTGHGTCWHCAVGCKPIVQTGEPYHVDPTYGGPEYETIGALGSNLDIWNAEAVAKGHELCNKYGLDSISAGGTIAWAMECSQRGLLSPADTGGLDLTFGSEAGLLETLEAIAFRRGFGDVLAEGAHRAAGIVGNDTQQYAIVSKKQEAPLHDPRGKGMLYLSYSTSDIGADHIRVEHDCDFDFDAPEIFLQQALPLGIYERLDSVVLDEQKVRMHYVLSQHFSFLDALCMCVFVAAPVRSFTFADITSILSAATGREVSLYELMKLGEKRTVMARCFNAREGISADDETLPDRFFEPLPAGVLAGKHLDRETFQAMKGLYYRLCGWDRDTGVPTPEKLWELELGWLVPEIERVNDAARELLLR